jgi:hypothetical protein
VGELQHTGDVTVVKPAHFLKVGQDAEPVLLFEGFEDHGDISPVLTASGNSDIIKR